MTANRTTTDLPTRIQSLLEERDEHETAIAHINDVLGTIYDALGMASPKRTPVRPAAPAIVSVPPAATSSAPRGRRRTRTRYATTGDESVLNFIRDHRNPTTKEIKAHWAGEKRGGTADNVLSKLYREKLIKRHSIPDERGSRYTVS